MADTDRKRIKVESRNEQFVDRTATRICQEIPSSDNPYIAARTLCHGYDLRELMQRRDYVDVLYLLMQGELPGAPAHDLLETLMIGLSHPGPRHPATRAVMTAAVSKTDAPNILPLGLSTLGGSHLGASEVESAMRFIRRHWRRDSSDTARRLVDESEPPGDGADWHIAAGFGIRFGAIDVLPGEIAAQLLNREGAGKALQWGDEFAGALNEFGHGWLTTGVAAAGFLDLGFHPRAGAGLFQLLCAPGLLAHGVEMANKPLTAMPFINEQHYFIDDE